MEKNKQKKKFHCKACWNGGYGLREFDTEEQLEKHIKEVHLRQSRPIESLQIEFPDDECLNPK